MQKVTGEFDQLSHKHIRKPVADVGISWTRAKSETIDFAIVGTTLVGDGDIIQGELGVITNADLFEYYDESDNLISLSTDLERVEPLGGVSYGRASIILDNTDGRYTENIDTTIGTSLVRNRPAKLFLGFQNENDSNLEIPIIYGITKDIEKDETKKTVKIPMFDYLSIIDNFELTNQVFVNKRTDEIIESILTEMGFVAEQYDLDVGSNTIGFVWIPKGAKAGNIIRQLAQSEGGEFYQNELGDVLFRTFDNLQLVDTVHISQDDVLKEDVKYSDKVYNHVTVKAQPRIVLAEQTIYEATNTIEVPTGLSDFFITLENPLSTLSTPVATTNWTANSVRDGSGSNVTASVAVTLTNFTDSIKVSINNTSGNIAYLQTLLLEGEPAVVEKVIEEVAEDTVSQEEYGILPLVIENDFITDADWASSYAQNIVDNYTPTREEFNLVMPALPQLMVGDKIRYHKKDVIKEYIFDDESYQQDFVLHDDPPDVVYPFIENGKLVFRLYPSSLYPVYEYIYFYKTGFDITNKAVTLKFGNVDSFMNGMWEASIKADGSLSFYIKEIEGTIYIGFLDDGEQADLNRTNLVLTDFANKWARFVELDGLFSFQISSDGYIYETIYTIKTPDVMYNKNLRIEFFAESWQDVDANEERLELESLYIENSSPEMVTDSDIVMFDSATYSDVGATGAVRTFSHTVAEHDNRVLIVGTAVRGAVTLDSLTYNGVVMTKIRHDQPGSDIRSELWYLLNPDVGTHDVVATFSADQNIAVVASSYFNVDSIGADDGFTGTDVVESYITMSNNFKDAIIQILAIQVGGNAMEAITGFQDIVLDYPANLSIGYSHKMMGSTNDLAYYYFTESVVANSAVVLIPTRGVFGREKTIKRIQTSFDANSGLIQNITMR